MMLRKNIQKKNKHNKIFECYGKGRVHVHDYLNEKKKITHFRFAGFTESGLFRNGRCIGVSISAHGGIVGVVGVGCGIFRPTLVVLPLPLLVIVILPSNSNVDIGRSDRSRRVRVWAAVRGTLVQLQVAKRIDRFGCERRFSRRRVQHVALQIDRYTGIPWFIKCASIVF